MAINRILGTLAALLLLNACDSEPEAPPSIYEGVSIATAFARLQPHVLEDYLSKIDTSDLANYRHGSESNIVHFAVGNEFHDHAIEVALQFGADINHQNNSGDTPIQKTIFHDEFEDAKKLIKLGARTDIINNQGYTAISDCEIRLNHNPNHRTCLYIVSSDVNNNEESKAHEN